MCLTASAFADVDAALLAQLGLTSDASGWKYSVVDGGARGLTNAEFSAVEKFIGGLEPSRRDAALADIVYFWQTSHGVQDPYTSGNFAKQDGDWKLTLSGMRNVVAAIVEPRPESAVTARAPVPILEQKTSPDLSVLRRVGNYSLAGPVAVDYDNSLRLSQPIADAYVLASGEKSVRLRGAAGNVITEEVSFPVASGPEAELKYENHDVHAGFSAGIPAPLPTQVDVDLCRAQRDPGFLNGFIANVEGAATGIFGQNASNKFRTGPDAITAPTNYFRFGKTVINGPAQSNWSSCGVTLGIKTALTQPYFLSRIPTIAANIALTLPGGSAPFGSPGVAAAGLSVQERLSTRWDAFGFLGAAKPLASADSLGIPYGKVALTGSLGVTRSFSENLGLILQYNLVGSPYRTTGLQTLDSPWGDVTLALRGLVPGARLLRWELCARENIGPHGGASQGVPDFGVCANAAYYFN